MMLEDIRRELKNNLGCEIKVETKRKQTITGTLSWISPDRSMVEVRLDDGSIETLMDIEIRSVKN